jgi:hypothetical protein
MDPHLIVIEATGGFETVVTATLLRRPCRSQS